jgi:hypothetical protein
MSILAKPAARVVLTIESDADGHVARVLTGRDAIDAALWRNQNPAGTSHILAAFDLDETGAPTRGRWLSIAPRNQEIEE